MLEITGLCKHYDMFSLGPIELRLEPGSVHGLVGPNGAGKSTLFRCIIGTVSSDGGLVRVMGDVAGKESGSWKRLVGYVGDYTPLFEHWSGARNLAAFSPYYPSWSDEAARDLAAKLDLDLQLVVKKYSTGQRAKLALILALAHNPKLLLLDEPANGLDPVARNAFMEVLYERMQDDNLTLLYATHHVSEIGQLVDQLIFIDGGKILRHDFVENLAENWRRITFSTSLQLDEIPGAVAGATQGHDHEVTTSNFRETMCFLEKVGVESIAVGILSMEQICIHILSSSLQGEKL